MEQVANLPGVVTPWGDLNLLLALGVDGEVVRVVPLEPIPAATYAAAAAAHHAGCDRLADENRDRNGVVAYGTTICSLMPALLTSEGGEPSADRSVQRRGRIA